MFTLALVFAVAFLSPIVFPLGALHLLYGCNTKTMANVTDISPVDAVTCNTTLYLPEYNTTAHTYLPCIHVIRCLPHYGIYDETCNNMLVLTNHHYHTASCLKPVLSNYDIYMSHETVETVMATTVAALVIVLSLVAIVTTKEPMSFP